MSNPATVPVCRVAINGDGAAGVTNQPIPLEQMPLLNFITNLFDASDWPARWACGKWSEAHGYLHIVSGMAIVASYTVIPFCLLIAVWRSKASLSFESKWMLCLFTTFIFACGLTHLSDVLMFYWPAYRLRGVLTAVTAVVSLWTSLELSLKIDGFLAILRNEQRLRAQEQRDTAAAIKRARQAESEVASAKEMLQRIRMVRARIASKEMTEGQVQTAAAITLLDTTLADVQASYEKRAGGHDGHS